MFFKHILRVKKKYFERTYRKFRVGPDSDFELSVRKRIVGHFEKRITDIRFLLYDG